MLAVGWGSGCVNCLILILVCWSHIVIQDGRFSVPRCGTRYSHTPIVDPNAYTKRSQPLDAITARAKTDGTTVSSSLSDTDLTSAAQTATGKDVAFVFITADSGYVGPIVSSTEHLLTSL